MKIFAIEVYSIAVFVLCYCWDIFCVLHLTDFIYFKIKFLCNQYFWEKIESDRNNRKFTGFQRLFQRCSSSDSIKYV